MAWIPRPLPLSQAEVERRVKAGARTLFEIDPALGEWHRRNQRLFAFQAIAIGISVVGLLAVFLMVAWANLMQ
jgi:hypothetical protein